MPEAAGAAASQRGGLLDSLKALARSLLALGQTRLEIAGTEIEEQRALLLREVLLALTVALLLALGVAFTALFVVLVVPLEHRAYVPGLFAVVFFVASGAAFVALRAAHRSRPRAFSATIQELGKDRESLQ
jgi:uncharacterized membrane protein YqjE